MYNVAVAIFFVSIAAGGAGDPLVELIQRFNKERSQASASKSPDEAQESRTAWIEQFDDALRECKSTDYVGEAEFIVGRLYMEGGNLDSALSHFDRVIMSPNVDPTLKYLVSDIAMQECANAKLPIERVRHFFEHYAANLPQVQVLDTDEETKKMIAYDTIRLSLTQAELFERVGAYTEAIGAYTAYLATLETSPEAAELADTIEQRHDDVKSILYKLASLYLFLAEKAESSGDFGQGGVWRSQADSLLWQLLDKFPPPRIMSRRGVEQPSVHWEPVAQLLQNTRIRNGVNAAYVNLAESIGGRSQGGMWLVVLELLETGCGNVENSIDSGICTDIASLAERLMVKAYPDDYLSQPLYHEVILNKLRIAVMNKSDQEVGDLIGQLSALPLSEDATKRLISCQESYLRQDSLKELLPGALGAFAKAIEAAATDENEASIPESKSETVLGRAVKTQSKESLPLAAILVGSGVCALAAGGVLYLLRRRRHVARNAATEKGLNLS